MLKKIVPLLLALVILFTQSTAQPFSLRSTGGGKAFQFDIFYGTEGKGAFVQYRGHQGIIPLKVKSRIVLSGDEKNGPIRITHVWDELVDGKITGSYGLTQQAEKLSGVWYRRKRDGKQFPLGNTDQQRTTDQYGVLISFYHTANERLTFRYPDGTTQSSQLPGFDRPGPVRQASIADYNFDGYDDVAFSIPDAGMAFIELSAFLYHPKLKLFKEIKAPDDARGNCSGLCDVTLDKKNKHLFTSCRGAATWWKDVYRFSKGNKLVWVSSGKEQ
jgi:hypothetical protein